MPRSDGGVLTEIALLVLISRRDSSNPAERLLALKQISQDLSPRNRAVVIGLPDSEKIPLRETGLFLFEENFEQEPFMQKVNDDAFKTAGDWYLQPELSGILETEGLQTASLIQHPFTYFLLAYFRDTALLSGLLNQHSVMSIRLLHQDGCLEPPDRTLEKALSFLWPPERTERAAKPLYESGSGLKDKSLQALWKSANIFFNFLLFRKKLSVLICSDLKHCDTVIPHLAKNTSVRLTLLRQKAGIRFWKFALRHFISMKFLPFSALEHEDTDLWNRLDRALSHSDVFKRSGVNLWPLMKPSFRSRLFSRLHPLGALYQEALNFLKKEKISAILFDEDVTPYNKTLATAARKLKIPSLVIQHGAPFRTVPIALAPVTASKIAAWGPYSRELLLSWGVPDHQISLTGVPRYDRFDEALNRQAEARKKVLRDIGGKSEQKIVVLATDPFHEDGRADFVGHYLSRENTQRLLDTVFRALAPFNDVCLVVKLHPRDPHEAYTQERILNSGLKDRVKLLRLYSTPSLLLACDILMTPCSTVAIEAMMLRKPVITINLEGGRDLQPHAETGAAVGAKDLESLSAALHKILHDDRFRNGQIERSLNVIPKYLARPEGGASYAAARVLLELIETNCGGKSQ